MKTFEEHQAYLRKVNKFNKDKGYRAKLSEMARKLPNKKETWESPRAKELKGQSKHASQRSPYIRSNLECSDRLKHCINYLRSKIVKCKSVYSVCKSHFFIKLND